MQLTRAGARHRRWGKAARHRAGDADWGLQLVTVRDHPAGSLSVSDPKPSLDEVEMTREIKSAAEALGIAIHDHLVIGRKGHASFRRLGLPGA
jgi:hypothetical protein